MIINEALKLQALKREFEKLFQPSKRKGKGDENARARKHGIPKRLRQYAKRYGNATVDDIVQMHKKYTV